ncbi:TetR/AcrR family transcriptional regulator [Geodermatophilus maliterrae]|uniref:TetR/AcrR family transcriptional regulator n=1 Tax=Geodermatophilus maliterrae TaxID=3162531 RepID=A0ABV3XF96_9ACTN
MAEAVAAKRGRPGGSTGSDLVAIARQVFLAQGFAGATMDAVAAGARISKQTLYRQYASKDALFAAVVRDWVDRGHDAMRPHTRALLAAPDLREGLLRLARVLQAGVLSTPVLQMRTLVAAEAERFPEVAADYVARSWDRNQRLLAEALAELAARGQLDVDDAGIAAEQFTWLALAAPLNRLTLQAGAQPSVDQDLEVIATEAVTTFLSRFGPAATAD